MLNSCRPSTWYMCHPRKTRNPSFPRVSSLFRDSATLPLAKCSGPLVVENDRKTGKRISSRQERQESPVGGSVGGSLARGTCQDKDRTNGTKARQNRTRTGRMDKKTGQNETAVSRLIGGLVLGAPIILARHWPEGYSTEAARSCYVNGIAPPVFPLPIEDPT